MGAIEVLNKVGKKNTTTRASIYSLVGLILITISVILSSCQGITPTDLTVTASQLITPSASQLITPSEYQVEFGDSVDHFLLDVRTPEEFVSGHIAGAVNISVESLPQRLEELPGDLPIVVYCRSGRRSAIAADLLVKNGYQSIYDLGGIQSWIAEGYPIE
jgi:rhodanese-related sulfurtransferase